MATAGDQGAFDTVIVATLGSYRGRRLAEIRGQRGRTQEQVAVCMGVSVIYRS